MFHMSYFTAAPQGLDISVGSLKQSERLLGETSSSLGEAAEEPDAPVWGVSDPVSRAQAALKSL